MSSTDPAKVALHYDELDDLYRSVWGDQLHHGLWDQAELSKEEAATRMTDYLAELAQLSAGGRLLDVGCGYGASAEYLSQKYDLSVLGVSLSQKQIGYAKAHHANAKTDFRVCDFLEASFSPGNYDYIWASECLSHMPSAEDFFKKCHQLLKPGGRLILAAWLGSEQAGHWSRRHLLQPICEEGRLYRLLSPEKCRSLLESENFQILHYEDLSAKVRRTWSVVGQGILKHFLTRPRDLAMLLPHKNSNASFGLSLLRIPIAYRVGAMKYGIYIAQKGEKKG